MIDEEDNISAGKPPPTIAAAFAGGERRAHLVLRYPDGIVEKIVDLAPIIDFGCNPLVENDALFATMRVNEDGNSLEFNGGFKILATTIEWLAEQ